MQNFIIQSLADFSSCHWYADSSTLAVFILYLELLCHHWKPGRTTNKKQEQGEKQILIGPRTRGDIG